MRVWRNEIVAWANGAIIEGRGRDYWTKDWSETWRVIENPVWNMHNAQYRVAGWHDNKMHIDFKEMVTRIIVKLRHCPRIKDARRDFK
jgi:hypothetical protein